MKVIKEELWFMIKGRECRVVRYNESKALSMNKFSTPDLMAAFGCEDEDELAEQIPFNTFYQAIEQGPIRRGRKITYSNAHGGLATDQWDYFDNYVEPGKEASDGSQ